MAAMAAIASMVRAAQAQGINMSRGDALHAVGGYKSQGKGRGTSFAPTDGSRRGKRAAMKARHRAANRRAHRG